MGETIHQELCKRLNCDHTKKCYIHQPESVPKNKVKLTTIVEGDLKAPFSIATTPRCRGGHYSIPWIASLYSWSLPYNAEFLAQRYQVTFFWVFGMTQPGIEPQSPEPLVNTLLIWPMARWFCDINPVQKTRLTKKENLSSSKFCCFVRPQSKNKRKQKDRQILGPCLRTKKIMEHEGDSDTNCSWCVWNGPLRLWEKAGEIKSREESWPSRQHHC